MCIVLRKIKRLLKFLCNNSYCLTLLNSSRGKYALIVAVLRREGARLGLRNLTPRICTLALTYFLKCSSNEMIDATSYSLERRGVDKNFGRKENNKV